jgi:hypothetical protein
MAVNNPDIGERVNVLIEIVSARGLLVGDFTSSDPYVSVHVGKKHKHSTKYIPKT